MQRDEAGSCVNFAANDGFTLEIGFVRLCRRLDCHVLGSHPRMLSVFFSFLTLTLSSFTSTYLGNNVPPCEDFQVIDGFVSGLINVPNTTVTVKTTIIATAFAVAKCCYG